MDGNGTCAVSRVDAAREKSLSRRRFRRSGPPRNCGNGGGPVLTDYLVLGLIGFAAQLVDGALGMAFGVISTAAMLSIGMPPAQASAIVHTAEIFTTGASASLPHLASQRRLAAGDTARHRGRARRGARRLDPVECRREHHAAVRGRLSRPARHLHPAQSLAARARRATRPAHGSGRSDLLQAFSMRAAAEAGVRSRRQASSAPVTRRAWRSARSTPPSSSSRSRRRRPSSSSSAPRRGKSCSR